jgi:hypothetical protein
LFGIHSLKFHLDLDSTEFTTPYTHFVYPMSHMMLQLPSPWNLLVFCQRNWRLECARLDAEYVVHVSRKAFHAGVREKGKGYLLGPFLEDYRLWGKRELIFVLHRCSERIESHCWFMTDCRDWRAFEDSLLSHKTLQYSLSIQRTKAYSDISNMTLSEIYARLQIRSLRVLIRVPTQHPPTFLMESSPAALVSNF